MQMDGTSASLLESEAQERFQNSFQYSAIGKAIVAADGRWLQVNRSLCELVGRTEEELLACTFQDITHPDDLDADLDYVRQMLAGEIPYYQMEKRYIHKDGHLVWILLSVSIVRGARDAPPYFVAEMQDITALRRAEGAVRESEERYRTVVETSPDGIGIIDLNGIGTFANGSLADMLGATSPAQLVGQPSRKFVAVEDRERVQNHLRTVVEEGSAVNLRVKLVHGDGVRFPVNISARLLCDQDGHSAGIITVTRDISEQVAHEARLQHLNAELEGRVALRTQELTEANGILEETRGRLEQHVTERTAELASANAALQAEIVDRERTVIELRESRQVFEQTIADSAAGMALVGTDGKFLTVNRALCELVGYSEEDLLALTFSDITHPDDLRIDVNHVLHQLSGDQHAYQQEKRYIRKNGELIWVLVGISLLRDTAGAPLFFISQMQDLTARKEMEVRLQTLLAERTETLQVAEHRSLHDPLTDLPNRRLLYERARRAIQSAARTDGHATLLLLDLDGFKTVNDTLGHHIGDAVLQEVATRLRATLRVGDTPARLGGDEFAILLPTESRQAAERVAEKIIKAIDRPFVIDEHALVLRGSIGAAIFPENGSTVETLMQAADVAMYVAKRRHLEAAVYEVDHNLHPTPA